MASDSSHAAPNSPEGSEVVTAELADGPRRRQSGCGWILILFIAATLLGPMLYYGIPSEAAKWHVAAAQNQWLEGDLEGAIQTLDAAIERYPNSAALYEQRIPFLLENGDYEQTLKDCNRLIELSPKSPEAYAMRGEALVHLDRHEEAVESLREMLRLSEEEGIGNRGMALNGLAYYQALAKVELQEALANVEEAIKLLGARPALLDTRGYIHYLLGDLQAAEKDLNGAIAEVDATVNAETARKPSQFRSYEVARAVRHNQETVAVIRYHRSLVYESSGKKEKAEEDRERVRELGFEPNDDLF